MVLRMCLIAPKVTTQSYRTFFRLVISTLSSAAIIFFLYCRIDVQQIQFLFVSWAITSIIWNHVNSPELHWFILVDNVGLKYSMDVSVFFRQTGKYDESTHVIQHLVLPGNEKHLCWDYIFWCREEDIHSLKKWKEKCTLAPCILQVLEWINVMNKNIKLSSLVSQSY